jgi:hypothetical protein
MIFSKQITAEDIWLQINLLFKLSIAWSKHLNQSAFGLRNDDTADLDDTLMSINCISGLSVRERKWF